MTNEEIARLVREHLSAAKSRWQEQLGEINFTVEAANVRNGDNWWRVMVRPSQEPRHLFALYDCSLRSLKPCTKKRAEISC